MKSSPENHWGASQYTWAVPIEVEIKVGLYKEEEFLILCDCTWFGDPATEMTFCWSECDNCLGYGTMPIDWSEVR